LLIFDAAYKELKDASNDKSVKELIGGILAALYGVKSLQSGLPSCESIETHSWNFKQFTKISDIAADPVRYFKPVTGDILIDGLPILWKTDKAVHAYNRTPQDLLTFG